MRSSKTTLRIGSVTPVALVAAMLSFFTASTYAQLEPGDVIVGVSRYVGFPGETESWIKIHTAAGAFKNQIPLPSRFGMRDLNFHSGSLFGLAGAGGIYRIESDGSLMSVGFSGPFVFDAAGNVYVSRAQQIDKYDLGGSLLNTWSLPSRPGYIDLAADQCTVYYTVNVPGPIEIARYNVCTSQSLAPLITGLTGLFGNLRILPGSEVLLATSNGALRIAPDGQIIRTYAAGYSQIALDPDIRSFWASMGLDSAWKIDLETGAKLAATTDFGGFGLGIDSITVVGEPRAAVSSATLIPTLSQWVLIALAITVAAVALLRLRP